MVSCREGSCVVCDRGAELARGITPWGTTEATGARGRLPLVRADSPSQGIGATRMTDRRSRHTTRRLCRSLLAATCLCGGLLRGADGETAAPDLRARLRPEHPRLFITRDNLPKVQARVKANDVSFANLLKAAPERTVDSARAWFEKHVPAEEQVRAGTLSSRQYLYRMQPCEAALRAAFAYLVEGDPAFGQLAAWHLERALLFYDHRAAQKQGVEWYVYNRLKWLIAFDWAYETIPEPRRVGMMERFLRDCRVFLTIPRGEGAGNFTTGYYNIPNIKFYLGLVAADMPVSAEAARLAQKLLTEGFAENVRLMDYREGRRGVHGGCSSPTLTYSVADYPFSMFNFLHCAQSALGLDMAAQYPRSFSFVNYIFWNMIFGEAGAIYEFGTGDLQRTRQGFPVHFIRSHISNLRHFYQNSASAGLRQIASTVCGLLPSKESSPFFFYPYLRERPLPLDPVPLSAFPKAFFFDSMGQTFMRSGVSPVDTYALFTCGGQKLAHAHLDALSFTIFKHGFQALDSGNRPRFADSNHWAYATSTAAHNTILIHMPDEPVGGNWLMRGKKYTGPRQEFGGQYRTGGSLVTAFEANDRFVYVAGDGTKTYRLDKAKHVSRQFLMLMPDVFVVYDRVEVVKPSYRIQWLIHTANQPEELAGVPNAFTAIHGKGRIVVQTLVPRSPTAVVTEGFKWADGTEMPIGTWGKMSPEVQQMQGKWRLEVSPSGPTRATEFLHVLRVQKRTDPPFEVTAECTQTEDTTGVRLTAHGRTYTVSFNRRGEVGGEISIARLGQGVLLARAFTKSVATQTVLPSEMPGAKPHRPAPER